MWEFGSYWCHPAPSRVLHVVSNYESQCTAGEEPEPTHLAEELANTLVEGIVAVVELADNAVGLGCEAHGERSGYRRRRREDFGVFADRLGGYLS